MCGWDDMQWKLSSQSCAQMKQNQSGTACESGLQHRRVESYLGRQVSLPEEGTQQEPRPEVALDLGPLGNFLLAR